MESATIATAGATHAEVVSLSVSANATAPATSPEGKL